MRKWIIPLVIFLLLAYCYESRWETLATIEHVEAIYFETYQWKIDKWTNKPWLFKLDSKGVWSRPLSIEGENKSENIIKYAKFLTKTSRLLLVVSFIWFIIGLNIYLKKRE